MTHEPTIDPRTGVATTCWLCGRRASGMGIGKFPSERRPNADPHLLCDNCVPLAAMLRNTTKFDHYEQNAVSTVIEKMGPVVEANGTDLAEWSAEQVEEFVVGIILGFGTEIRRQVAEGEVPF